jgi:hypothetical protein
MSVEQLGGKPLIRIKGIVGIGGEVCFLKNQKVKTIQEI